MARALWVHGFCTGIATCRSTFTDERWSTRVSLGHTYMQFSSHSTLQEGCTQDISERSGVACQVVPSLCTLKISMPRQHFSRMMIGTFTNHFVHNIGLLTPSVLGHIVTVSFGCDYTILFTLGSVYGGKRINDNSLYNFNPHRSFRSCKK